MKFDHKLLPEASIVAEMVDGKRHYLTPEGNKYPSITTVLSKMSADSIAQWRANVGEEKANQISSAAARRGTKVHELAEAYVLGKSVENPMPLHVEMFKPIQKFLDEKVGTIYGCEIGLYSDRLKVAGRCDLVCSIGGVPTIVDFKTASKPKKESYITNYFYQATAYGMMVKERHKLPVESICILISVQGEGMQVFHKPMIDYKLPLIEYLVSIGHLTRP